MKKIVFTGGHHNSALEVAKVLMAKGYQIIWIGHKHTMQNESSLSFEYQEVTNHHIQFIELVSGKFYRPSHYTEWLKIPGGIWSAYRILKTVKPKLIVSFGGYLSTPVVLAGWWLKIPSVCHEQTTTAGWANRLNARVAAKVFISWPESLRYFPVEKTLFTGVPLRRTVMSKLPPITRFSQNRPTILVTGGKQGSHVINQTVGAAYRILLEKYNLIHQCGGLRQTRDYDRLTQKKRQLPPRIREGLYLRKYFFQTEMCRALRQADLVIGRAGAHTVYELLALGKPALYIPLRKSMTAEQIGNARKAVSFGLGEILEEENLKPKTLLLKVAEIIGKLPDMQLAGRNTRRQIKKDATEVIATTIEKML